MYDWCVYNRVSRAGWRTRICVYGLRIQDSYCHQRGAQDTSYCSLCRSFVLCSRQYNSAVFPPVSEQGSEQKKNRFCLRFLITVLFFFGFTIDFFVHRRRKLQRLQLWGFSLRKKNPKINDLNYICTDLYREFHCSYRIRQNCLKLRLLEKSAKYKLTYYKTICKPIVKDSKCFRNFRFIWNKSKRVHTLTLC